MSVFGKRLQHLRKDKELTQSELAKMLGVAKSTISMYENSRREPNFEFMESVADFFNVDMDYLYGKSEDKNKNTLTIIKRDGTKVKFDTNLIAEAIRNSMDNDKFKSEKDFDANDIKYRMRQIPIVGTVAAGTPILAEENIEDYFSIDARVNADFALRVKGDSMINADIFDGDIAFIRQQCTLENGEIGVILLGEEATLKRFTKTDGTVILQAENPKTPGFPMVFTNGDLRILGKLVGVYSNRE